MTIEEKKSLIQEISKIITPERFAKMQEIVKERTDYVTVVLEDIFKPQNASAALRSCDGFGIANVHIIEDKFKFKPCDHISKGSSKWLKLNYYNTPGENNTKNCFDALRSQGYKVVATTPHEKNLLLPDLPIDTPIALVMGNEQTGISDYVFENADMFVKIPIYGFVESYNISVSASVCLYQAVTKVRACVKDWQLSESEMTDLILEWLLKTTDYNLKPEQTI